MIPCLLRTRSPFLIPLGFLVIIGLGLVADLKATSGFIFEELNFWREISLLPTFGYSFESTNC